MAEKNTEKTTKKHTKDPKFFIVAPSKLAVMSIATFGLYEIYWAYKNWQAIKEADDSNIMPFWRAVFAIFFAYRLFQRMGAKSPMFLFVAYILLGFAVRLPEPWDLIAMLSFGILYMIQTDLNERLNKQPAAIYSTKATAVAVIGGLLVLAYVSSYF